MVQSFLHQVRRAVGRAQQEPVEAGDAEQTEPDDEHPRDRSTAERHRERLVQSGARRLGRAHVRAHGDVHPDVAGEAGEEGADRETARRRAAERPPDDDEQHEADDADGQILAIEVRLRAGLDRRGDFAHPVVAGRLRHDPADRHGAIDDRGNGADEREHEF